MKNRRTEPVFPFKKIVDNRGIKLYKSKIVDNYIQTKLLDNNLKKHN